MLKLVAALLVIVNLFIVVPNHASASSLESSYTSSGCYQSTKIRSGSYWWDLQDRERGRVHYEVKYHITSDCRVYVDQVRSRHIGPSLSEICIMWTQIRTENSSYRINQCLDWITGNGGWTNWVSVDQYVPYGSQFTHLSGYRVNRSTSYGYMYLK